MRSAIPIPVPRRLPRYVRSFWLLLLFLPIFSQASAAQYAIEKAWDVSVGPAARDGFICASPDGRINFINPDGAWVVLNQEGQQLNRLVLPELVGATSIACSQNGKVYVMVTSARQVYVYTGDGLPAGSITVPQLSRRICVDKNGTIYATSNSPARAVIRIDPDGNVIPFQAIPDYPNRFVARNNTFNSVLWLDESEGRIIYKPKSPYRFTIFDLDGRTLRTEAPDPRFRPSRFESVPGGAHMLPSDWTAAFVKLHSGLYLVVVGTQDVRNRIVTGRARIDVLNSSFRPLGQISPTIGFSSPMAVDQNDNIYGGYNSSPSDESGEAHVWKARLVGAPQPTGSQKQKTETIVDK